MLIPRLLFAPHLPTLLVDQHRGHLTPMIEALAAAGERLRADEPEAIVIVSGRRMARGPFVVDAGRRHRTITEYRGLGVELRDDCDGLPALARALVEHGEKHDIPVAAGTRGVDSGVTVPLHFLMPRTHVPVVPLSVALQPRAKCRAWGKVIAQVLVKRPERIAFLVGGALSSDEHAWNLQRQVPEADAYDERALECLERGAWEQLWTASAGMAKRAQPQAGLRHLAILRGVLGADLPGHVLCHEPGPGMGAALVEFERSAEKA
jgi:aromatic ring-opening dioxygenase catalytic subunit (LigB family)